MSEAAQRGIKRKRQAAILGVIGVIRLALVLCVIAIGAILCPFAGVMGWSVYSRIARVWHRAILFCLGVRARYVGAPMVRGALLFCNHISWLDIVLFGAKWRVNFLANRKIADWFVLGWVIRKSGTLFIERGSGAKAAIRDLGDALKAGRNIVLFPEGKTTAGAGVLRFQPRLAQAALDAAAPLQPAAIRYFDTAGRRINRHTFAGDATLISSAWQTVYGKKIIAEVTLFPAIHDAKTRQEIAKRAEEVVRELVEIK